MINFAQRAKDHQYNIDPIVRSLLDTDFYKLAMCQLIWMNHRDDEVTFAVKNRTTTIKLASVIDHDELVRQLDYTKALSFTRGEVTWLRGNTFYGRKQIFSPEFIDWLENDFQLPSYHLAEEDGQIVLEMTGTWASATLWETYVLTIINTLRNRSLMSNMNLIQLDVMFARAKSKLWNKLSQLTLLPNLKLSDFGTRRRFDFLWQEWVVLAMKESLGDKFVGTSNMLIAKLHDLEPIGTNAHELPMVYAALANSDEELVESPYNVLADWNTLYDGNMLIMLPDTFGTEEYLKNMPDWAVNWKGFRLDSKDNFIGGDEFIDFWNSKGIDPQTKTVIHSDGLDVGTGDSSDIVEIYNRFNTKYNVGFGWGTKATNDFKGCSSVDFSPISLVCKVKEVNGRPCVKLSDNPAKATGPASEITRYTTAFNMPIMEGKITDV